MAIAGDIIIKLVADFAEFAEGMTKSTKLLGDLGKEVEKTSASLQSAIGWLKGIAGAAAVTFVIGKITAYTDAIDQQALAVAKLQKQYKLSAIEVQALQAQVDKTGKSFAELVEHASKNPKWLDSVILDARTAGTALDEGVIRSIADMDEKSTEATKKINAMFAPFYANTKATALENIANTLSDIIARMDEAAAHPDFWSKVGSFFQPGVFDPNTGEAREANATERQANNMAAAEARLAALRAAQAAAIAGNTMFPHELKTLADNIERAEAAINRVRNAATNRAARANAATTGNAETNVPFVPDLPATTVTGTRGGGGRTDAETIDALILRYQKMQKAAEAAGAAVAKDTASDIKDLVIRVEARQAAQDAVAKLAQNKQFASPEQEKALENAIFLAKKAQAEQNRFVQDAVAADATQKRLGDGTAALADAMQNLDRQYATNLLSADAYARATKQVEESTKQAALQAARYDDDLGSLAAGFQSAAMSYARSNDMFSQGGQLFSGVTDAMGQGLDVLVGKSSKTFGQIASDFATMLTKMALQAALSPVFKYLSQALGSWIGGGMGSAGQPGSPYYGPVAPSATATARAGGGSVYAGQPYWVGEYGAERFVPAAAGRIEPAGGGGDMYVNIANYSDQNVSAKKSKGPGGNMQLDVVVGMLEQKMSARMAKGQGSLGRTMQGMYGLQPVGR